MPPAVVAAPSPPPPPPPPAPAPAPQTLELAFWEAIKGSNNVREFQAYLEQYPTGGFAPLARARVQELMPPPPQQAALPPPAAPPASAPPARPESSINGRYVGIIPGTVFPALGQLDLTLDISDTKISGWANAARDIGAVCHLNGIVSRVGSIARLGLTCGDLSAGFTGYFGYSSSVKARIGQTNFKTHDGKTGEVLWREPGASLPQASQPAGGRVIDDTKEKKRSGSPRRTSAQRCSATRFPARARPGPSGISIPGRPVKAGSKVRRRTARRWPTAAKRRSRAI
ncbi:MAG: hypothetical protein ACT4P2_00470 [Pseudomonadota bacterium]